MIVFNELELIGLAIMAALLVICGIILVIDRIKRFCKRWGTEIPTDEKIMKAGIYKAAQECKSIPKEVKKIAAEKCVALGFKPTMWG